MPEDNNTLAKLQQVPKSRWEGKNYCLPRFARDLLPRKKHVAQGCWVAICIDKWRCRQSIYYKAMEANKYEAIGRVIYGTVRQESRLESLKDALPAADLATAQALLGKLTGTIRGGDALTCDAAALAQDLAQLERLLDGANPPRP